jgi:hypothetical protein
MYSMIYLMIVIIHHKYWYYIYLIDVKNVWFLQKW